MVIRHILNFIAFITITPIVFLIIIKIKAALLVEENSLLDVEMRIEREILSDMEREIGLSKAVSDGIEEAKKTMMPLGKNTINGMMFRLNLRKNIEQEIKANLKYKINVIKLIKRLLKNPVYFSTILLGVLTGIILRLLV